MPFYSAITKIASQGAESFEQKFSFATRRRILYVERMTSSVTRFARATFSHRRRLTGIEQKFEQN
jgi:hypothetical protein